MRFSAAAAGPTDVIPGDDRRRDEAPWSGSPDAEMTPRLLVQPVRDADAPAIRDIYAHYVLHGTATFEEDAPDAAAMVARIDAIVSQGYPWLVAVEGAEVLGFAYLGPHKARSAYRFTAEVSIYIAAGHVGQGIGTRLLQAILHDAEQSRRFASIMAVIGDSANAGSIALHRKLGFARIGTARGLGYKFGRFVDVVYMQRRLPADPTRQSQATPHRARIADRAPAPTMPGAS